MRVAIEPGKSRIGPPPAPWSFEYAPVCHGPGGTPRDSAATGVQGARSIERPWRVRHARCLMGGMPRRTLAPLLDAVLASALPVLGMAACGGAEATTGTSPDAGSDAGRTARIPPTVMPESAACTVTDAGNRYASLSLAPGLDGAVFRSVRRTTQVTGPDGGVASTATTGSLGEPCKTARDRDACLRAVDAATSATGWTYAVENQPAANEIDYGVVTQGDTVRVLATWEDLRGAVAPVETPSEALALLVFATRAVSCGGPNMRTEADGWVFQTVRGGCGGPQMEYLTKVDRDGRFTVIATNKLSDGDPDCIEGRRPAGFVREGGVSWLASLPAHLAEIAHMEAAAVVAFEQLAKDLRACGAPRALLARLEESREDEVRHARIFRELAEAAGAPVDPVITRSPSATPSLLALAIDNAVEGCAREAYGALVARHQARTASDPVLRAAFACVAEDEARHAALSFDLAAWFGTRLGPAERALVGRAHARALRDLAHEGRHEPAPEVRERAGMPSARVARVLLEGLARALPRAA